MAGSHPAIFGHGQRLAIADDEMIEHPHIDQPERIAEPARQLPISLARFGHARGMIVGQNDRCGIVRQRALDHLTGIHTGPVDGAVKQRCSSI